MENISLSGMNACGLNVNFRKLKILDTELKCYADTKEKLEEKVGFGCYHVHTGTAYPFPILVVMANYYQILLFVPYNSIINSIYKNIYRHIYIYNLI